MSTWDLYSERTESTPLRRLCSGAVSLTQSNNDAIVEIRHDRKLERDAVTQTNPTSNTSNSDYSSDTIGSLSPTMLEVLDTLRNILRKAYYGSPGVLNPAFTAVDSALADWNTKIDDLKNQLSQALMS